VVGDRLRPAVAETGGSMVVLSYPAEAKLSREHVWGPVGDGAAVMQRIKNQFDPKGILNPDSFLFDGRRE
jgi:FAD/FMN-containing dehydrogenase